MKPFEFLIEECIKLISEEKNIIIHCSAGIGRTGTLGGIIEAIRLYEKNKKISIYQIVENMRKYRYYAVQTFEQYNFMYDYLRKILK
jgi:protein tyrosine phosphatase